MPFKNKHQYYVAEKGLDQIFNAGALRKDHEAIMDSMGFIPLHFDNAEKRSVVAAIARFFQLLLFVSRIKKYSLVVFHFPMHATVYKWLLILLKWRNIDTVAIIVDIDGLRDKDSSLLNREIRLLSSFKYLVAHNAVMKNWLLQQLPGACIYIIGLFDYPVAAAVPSRREYSTSICFAGNLAKATFVYALQQTNDLGFNVYGEGYHAALHINDSFCYQGIFKPAALPAKMEGSFGLVWDGDAVDNCDDYLRYNNPHKLSLYLAAGLPVIVWEQSAVAGFVKEKNIGICIHQLSETAHKIKAITGEAYNSMQQNASAIGKQLKDGFYLTRVLQQINSDIQKARDKTNG